MNRRVLLALWLAGMLLGAAGCADRSADASDPVLDPTALEIPRADADSVDATVKNLMAERQQQVRQALDRDPFDASAAGEAFSALGKLYFAYEFYPAAGACFGNAAKLADQDARYAYYEGLVAQATGDPPAAVEAFERADRLQADDIPTLIRLGDARFEQGEPARAAEAYSSALSLNAGEAAALFGLGRVDEEAGRLDEAITRFERTLELQPEAQVVHYRLGQLHRRNGDLERARHHLEQRGTRRVSFEDPLGREIGLLTVQTAFTVVRRLAESEPFNPSDAVGFAIAQFGDTTGAVEAFEKTLDDGGALSELARGRVHYVLASLYQRAGDYEQAVEHYQLALEGAPELTLVHERLAGLMLRFGNPERAMQHAREAVRHDPQAALPQLRLGAVLEAQGDGAGAFAAWKRATELEPQNGEGWLRLALAHEERGAGPAAADAYRKALALDTLDNEDRAIALHRLGQTLLRGGDAAGAETAWQSALDLDPGWTEPKVALAGLQAASGRLEQAVGSYVEVLAERPSLAQARMGHATALILLGRHAEARNSLEAGLTLDDGNLDYARTLARHLSACPDRTVRDGRRALELAQRVARESNRLEDGETLAMAMAEAGQFDQAAGLQRSLLDQVKAAGAPPALVSRLEGNLALYQGGQSCCG